MLVMLQRLDKRLKLLLLELEGMLPPRLLPSHGQLVLLP